MNPVLLTIALLGPPAVYGLARMIDDMVRRWERMRDYEAHERQSFRCRGCGAQVWDWTRHAPICAAADGERL